MPVDTPEATQTTSPDILHKGQHQIRTQMTTQYEKPDNNGNDWVVYSAVIWFLIKAVISSGLSSGWLSLLSTGWSSFFSSGLSSVSSSGLAYRFFIWGFLLSYCNIWVVLLCCHLVLSWRLSYGLSSSVVIFSFICCCHLSCLWCCHLVLSSVLSSGVINRVSSGF
jgi:hypothetical protein